MEAISMLMETVNRAYTKLCDPSLGLALCLWVLFRPHHNAQIIRQAMTP